MTHLYIKTDASYRGDRGVGIGFTIERVNEQGEQEEMLVKSKESLDLDEVGEH